MPRKTYSEQFKLDAVELHHSSPELTITALAAELGINRNTLKTWIRTYTPDTHTGASPASIPDAQQAKRIAELKTTLARVQQERDILRRATQYFGGRDDLVSRFQFIDDTRTEFPVKRLCQVLGINRSSYYKYQATRPRRTARLIEDALLAARVITVFTAAGGCYGARRVTVELNDTAAGGGAAAAPVNRKRVARLMAAHRLAGLTTKRCVTTTVAEKSRRVFADLVHRDFTAEAPNQLYVGDITYLPIADGSNMYLATVIDCFSRQLVGFAIADHMRTSPVQEAISQAAGRRGNCGGLGGAVFHSDHGSVYTSGAFQKTCRDLKITQSMGTAGSSADNALAESFNAALKREVLRGRRNFATQLVCRREVFAWCVRYNTVRRHSWCGYLTPQGFEEARAV
nr:IS3 family transposase [Corynebacterium glyciniphilum]